VQQQLILFLDRFLSHLGPIFFPGKISGKIPRKIFPPKMWGENGIFSAKKDLKNHFSKKFHGIFRGNNVRKIGPRLSISTVHQGVSSSIPVYSPFLWFAGKPGREGSVSGDGAASDVPVFLPPKSVDTDEELIQHLAQFPTVLHSFGRSLKN
jgi:hypothetical protein